MDVNEPSQAQDWAFPTSAQLRIMLGETRAALLATQRDLAASQADLTRVERERDEARAEVLALQRSEDAELAITKAELASARAELASLRQLPLVGSDAGHQHEHPDGCTWPLEQCHGHTPDTPRTDAPGNTEGDLPQ